MTGLVKAPVYQQLNELLRQIIKSGEVRPGAQFLTERQISERFEVSRATANKALSNLVSEGVLEFRKGLGTFVQGGVLDVDLGLLVSFTARAESVGRKPQTRVLSCRKVTASDVEPEVASRLDLGASPAILLERLRMTEAEPVILERRVVVARHAPALDAKLAAGSLYAYFTKKLRLAISGAEQVIRAVAATAEEAEHLAIKRGAPCMEVVAVGHLNGNVPLWWERTLYRGDSYQFSNRVGGRGSGGAMDLVRG
jgi:GntR family transcriptional regulator